MIIAVSGIKRSASTVQYNLVRISLEYAGYTVNPCKHEYEPREVPEGEVDLVKRHKFSYDIANAADHIFLTDRKDEEILASLERFTGQKQDPKRIKDMRRHLLLWKHYTDIEHWFHYEGWKEDKINYTQKIIEALELDFSYKEALNVLHAFNQIEPPEDEYDPVTCLYPEHITS